MTIPIDRAHYLSQTDDPRAAEDVEAHFLKVGASLGLRPTPFFETRWYAWQNPDWVSHENPYLHYLDVGRWRGRDPSPRVDVKRYLQVMGRRVPPEHVYEAILAGQRCPALGVYEGWEDLEAAQRRFKSAIELTPIRLELDRRPNANLVVLQAGPQSVHRSWYRDRPRTWDLLVNYYDVRGNSPSLGDYAFAQVGTKFTGIDRLLREFPELFERYRSVLLLDDDIELRMEQIDTAFAMVDAERLDLAQPSLTADSHCVWKPLFRKRDTGWRRLNAVEIMMPILSGRLLLEEGAVFGQSVSGFGIDLYLGKRVLERGGEIGILDSVSVRHGKPIDDAGGAYYEYMRANLINPKAELWRLIEAHGLDTSIRELD